MRAKKVVNGSRCKCDATFPGEADVSSGCSRQLPVSTGAASCSVLTLRVCGCDTLRPDRAMPLHAMTAFTSIPSCCHMPDDTNIRIQLSLCIYIYIYICTHVSIKQ